MIYLVYGFQKPLVDKRIKDIVGTLGLSTNDFDLSTYDLSEINLAELVSDLTTIPLLNDHKVVIGKNPFFLTNEKNIKVENDYKEFSNFIQNHNQFSTLILVSYQKIDIKNDLVKLIKKHGQIVEVEDFSKNDWPGVIAKLFINRKVNISKDALALFTTKVGNDLERAIQEADKLSTFSNNLILDDIKALVSSPLEDDVFSLTNALIDKDYKKAIKVFKDLKVQSHEPISILPIIANQMRFMYQVFYLNKQRLSEKQIVDELNAHPYRVSLTLSKVRKVQEAQILKVNHQLAKLDQDIKSGTIDRFYGFELFILNQIRAGNYGN